MFLRAELTPITWAAEISFVVESRGNLVKLKRLKKLGIHFLRMEVLNLEKTGED